MHSLLSFPLRHCIVWERSLRVNVNIPAGSGTKENCVPMA